MMQERKGIIIRRKIFRQLRGDGIQFISGEVGFRQNYRQFIYCNKKEGRIFMDINIGELVDLVCKCLYIDVYFDCFCFFQGNKGDLYLRVRREEKEKVLGF